MANWELKSCADSTAVAVQCAAEFISWAAPTSAPRSVALSGGRIAQDFFRAVARLAKGGGQSLAHVHFFWADERCVPPYHAESNYRSAAELLFTPLGLPTQNLHRILGEAEPEFAAREAESELRRLAPTCSTGQPMLDLVLLGMGEDGHIASLFPGEPAAAVNSPSVYRAVTASKPPPRRITLGYAAIAAAREVWVLVSGPGKGEALRESLFPEPRTPLARALHERGRSRIFTDITL
ncbi:MAG: 6-phosphogluconolactonase [Verrucomicrobia bacterium]|nr:6-phosphogluconolactonase [Verrucomicrobiota bacterium]